MSTLRTGLVLALLAALALSAWLAGTASADGPPAGTAQTVLEPQPAGVGERSVMLSAKLHDSAGQPLSGVPVEFYVLTTVFGERLMKVGEALTDTTGTAWLVYEQTWVGEHTIVARFDGNKDYAAAQTGSTFITTTAAPGHENAAFGLEPVRQWLPLAVGVVVLAVWLTLGLVVVRTVFGIPAAGPAPQPSPALPLTGGMRPAALAPVWLALAAAILVGVPAGWLLLKRGGGEEAFLSTQPVPLVHTHGPEGTEMPLSTALVEFVPLAEPNTQGQPAGTGSGLPTDVAVIDDRAFVLDSSEGRILAVEPDGKSASILESALAGDVSLRGAMAMTAHEGKLYVANSLAGDVVVVTPSGRVERVIRPQSPAGDRPLTAAGIAVTAQGEIWLSDSENHRVLLVGGHGELLRVIGESTHASGEYGFDAPGSLALDRAGNLYVVDTMNRQVKKYSPLGVFLMAIGETATGEALAQPQGIAVHGTGTIFVSDGGLAAVHVLEPDGNYRAHIEAANAGDTNSRSRLQDPYGLTMQGDKLYVVDRLAGLFVFDIAGIGGQ